MKKLIAIVTSFVFILALVSCTAKTNYIECVSGKSFMYDKGGIEGDFVITINDDGTFIYSEGLASSHLGIGNWNISNDTLTLTEEDRINIFTVQKDKLIWKADGSDNFIYITVDDGEAFNIK